MGIMANRDYDAEALTTEPEKSKKKKRKKEEITQEYSF